MIGGEGVTVELDERFICLPKPVKFGACTSIRLLGSCQEDSECDTRVCCKDWCGNYCAFKQRAYAVGNRRRPTGGDDLLPEQRFPQRPRGDSDGPDRTDQGSSEDEDDGGSPRRRGRYRRRYKR
ncbi:hypothetical protein IscW_ISCW004087 [Ixodes scapularis]|uniref:Uncharacterized protein n=1 Tax=Ixodes scapularis TaxID=6945 RepID=B7PJT9_IXOSC|nr:hypothetical protein IscW_ISCW004087 [Ixodes scapularis]|eukprot:XP_002408620.1 hypothetical protein IscW_ISCW004087 [Ixodes scapularis]